MRHILSRRASAKRASQSKGKERNMAATANTTDGGGVVAAVGGGGGGGGSSTPSSPVPDWTGDPVLLKEFANKRKVPGFARVVKGSYMTIGSSKFSLQKQHHDVYVHSVKMGVKVLAHCLKRVEMPGHRRGQSYTRLHAMDQRLAVPISYQGWFELLSEDGKSARPIASVPELAKVFPVRCLVRENIKGYLSTGEGRFTFDKTKIIPAGEQLKLCGEVPLPAPSEGVKVKLLRCVDTKGDNVFLSFDQKGLFTPIAGENDFTGVFNIRDIVRRFRLPLTVKLAHGVRPRVPDSKFSGLIRLDWVYTEETAFVCPVEKNHVRLLPVPTDVSLQLVAASNPEEMCNSDLFRSMQAKCGRMVSNYNNTLHLIVMLPESVMKTQSRNARASNIFSAPLQPEENSRAQSGRMRRSRSREDILMAEIDDLYGYVRDGGVPPKPKFQYDSDEESYWEEPAYEPLNEFQARLKAIESGQHVSFPSQYRPADLKQLEGLVGSGGVPAPAPGAAGGGEQNPAVTSEGDYGVMSNGRPDATSTNAVSEQPPPLPPRRSDTPSAAANNNSSGNATVNQTPTPSTPEKSRLTATKPADPIQPSSVRRVSAPLIPLSRVSNSAADQTQNASAVEASAKTSTDSNNKDSTNAPPVSPRRVSRSDSEPSVTETVVPALSAAARPSPSHRQQNQGEMKLDWKERLRRFNAMQDKDKEGSSSTSSGSVGGQQKGVQRLARDFKDSDISSRTKASSGSSGGRGAKKRMQTLYL